MKLKNVISTLAAVFAVVAIAAGVAAVVYRIIGKHNGEQNYIECECDPDSI